MIAPHFIKRLGIFIVGLLSAFILSGFASYILQLSNQNSTYKHVWAVIGIVIYLLFIYFAIKLWRNKLRKTKPLVNLKINVLWLAIAIILMLIMYFILSDTQAVNHTNKTYNTTTLVYTFIFYVGFAPIVEETICRGWFLSLFYRKNEEKVDKVINVVGGCIISSYISTMMHGFIDLTTTIPLFINGIIAALLYFRSKSIILPIIFHLIINLMAWLAMF